MVNKQEHSLYSKVNMTHSLVSILIPVYNVEQYLDQCLDSVVGQTYQELQIVIIDDGSKDGSFDICQNYANKDSRIEVYHQENQGVATTRNHLLEKIKGDYVLFVDADDWIELDMIETMLNLSLKYDADIVNCQNVKNDDICSKNKTKIELWFQEDTIYHFLRHLIFNGSLWNKLIRARLLHGLKFHSEISYGEDALFCWQVLQRIKTVVRTPNEYYHYRMNDTSLSHRQYDAKHMSGHMVWKQISEDTIQLWPQYSAIASANFAISDMWQLYYAALSNYPKDSKIKAFQLHVRKNLWLILKSRLLNKKKFIYAIIISYNYCIGRKLTNIL